MTRQEIIRDVVHATGIETKDVDTVVSALFKTIIKHVGKGKRVDFRGFGCFQPKVRKAKTGQDMLRKKPIHIPERVEPSFKHSKRYFKIKQPLDV